MKTNSVPAKLYSLVVSSWTKEEYKCEEQPYVEIISISDKVTAYEKFLRFKPENKDLYIEVSIWESESYYFYDEMDFSLTTDQFMKQYDLNYGDLMHEEIYTNFFEPEYKKVNEKALIAIFQKRQQDKLELKEITFAYLKHIKTEYDLISDEHFVPILLIENTIGMHVEKVKEIAKNELRYYNNIINKSSCDWFVDNFFSDYNLLYSNHNIDGVII